MLTVLIPLSCRLNKGFSSKFPVGYPDLNTPDEDQKSQRPKHDDKNEDNSLNVNKVRDL